MSLSIIILIFIHIILIKFFISHVSFLFLIYPISLVNTIILIIHFLIFTNLSI